MVFVGVHTDERGTPVRCERLSAVRSSLDAHAQPKSYKLLNSWGPSSGINGYAVMSPDFFEVSYTGSLLHRRAR